MQKAIVRRGAVSVLLVLTILFSLSLPAFAAESSIEKPTKTYDIAVAFDNSGSMYGGNGPESWCRAKYAMEIFASMLNFGNGDRMTIFPMWYVSTGAEPETVSKAVVPVSIEGIEDLQTITYMFTPQTDGTGTPFAPVEEAFRFLRESDKTSAGGQAAEKWLIVLTDGTFNLKTRTDAQAVDFTRDELKNRFLKMASKDIKVQYLAIGAGIEPEADLSQSSSPESYFFADLAKDTKAVTDQMIEICNRIFERQALPKKFVKSSEHELTLDVSMSNLIVFVAGKDAKVISMKDSQGNDVPFASNSGVRRYSDLKYSNGKHNSNDYYNTKVDASLYGQVVAFEKCPKGVYSLNFSGEIQVFYEPDIRVDIQVAADPDGVNVIEPNREGETKTLEEGEYYVFFDLVDNVTGEPVTKNPLVDLKRLETSMSSELNGEIKSVKLDRSGTAVSFTEGETIVFEVEGEYLDGYHIRTKDNVNEYTFKIKKSTTLKLKLEQEQTWYQTGKEDKWAPIIVQASLGKKALDPEIFDKCVLDVQFEPALACQVVPDAEHSRFLIYPGRDQDGNAASPEIGHYRCKASMRCTDDNEKISPSRPVSASFKVRSYPFWYCIAAGVLLLLLLVGLVLFILSRKAMPKNIVLVGDSTVFRVKNRRIEGLHATVKYSKKGKSLMIKCPPYDLNPLACGSVTFKLAPIDRLWTKSKNRRVTVTGISTTGSVGEIDLLGVTYEKHPKSRKWMDASYLDDDTAETQPRPISQNIRNASLEFVMKNGKATVSDLNCELKHK